MIASAEEAVGRLAKDRPDLVIMDIRMPGMDGLEAFQRIKKLDAKLPVIVMKGQGTTESAIQATKLGAFNDHLKPFEPGDMLRDLEKALESVRLMRRHVRIDAESAPLTSDAIIGQSSTMQHVYKAIGRVAETDATVLIRGSRGQARSWSPEPFINTAGVVRRRYQLSYLTCKDIEAASVDSA